MHRQRNAIFPVCRPPSSLPPPSQSVRASASTTHGGYRAQLDSLRSFAVAGVLVTHFWQPSFTGAAAAIDLGFLGVRLFFVLSGFLITGILLDARDSAERAGAGRFQVLARFYARRVLRIFPLYYLLVLGGLVVGIPRARDAWPWLLGYASNFYELVTQRSIGQYGHFWTLAVEEQFYLVWPWLVLFAPIRRLAALMLAAVLSAMLYRDLVRDVFLTERGWDMMPIGSLDTLASGALLALAFRRSHSPARVHRLLNHVALPLGLVAYIALHVHASVVGDDRLVIAGREVAFALVCCWAIAGAYRGFGGVAGTVLEWRPLVYLGRISYGIYAWHMLLPWALARGFERMGWTFPAPGPERFVVTTAATVVLAVASWHLVEAPINARKRRIPYHGARPPQRVAAAA